MLDFSAESIVQYYIYTVRIQLRQQVVCMYRSLAQLNGLKDISIYRCKGCQVSDQYVVCTEQLILCTRQK